ncbi:ABC transporter ATP-binding protein [Clavibacter sepedonicus]|uniref:ABC transporter ATP-binding protein n=1 Tax=Clavibacter sepedonicus TaxID=31964 RepID=UPI003DA22171
MLSAIWRVWRTSPRRYALAALMTWIAAVVPGLQIALTAEVVDAVADGAAAGAGIEYVTVALPLFGLFAAQVAQRLLSSAAQYLMSHAGLLADQAFSKQSLATGLGLSQSHYEDPAEYNRIRRALSEIQGNRVSSLPETTIDTLAAFVSIVSISVSLFSWHPLASILVLLSPLPGVGVAALFGRHRWSLDVNQTESRRMINYLQALSMSDQSHKELAHYRLGGHIRARFSNMLQTLLRQDVRQLRQSQTGVTGADLFGMGFTILALVLVVNSVIGGAGSVTVGNLAGFIQGMNSLYGVTIGALGGIAGIYQASLYARNLFDFVDTPIEKPLDGGEPFPEVLAEGITFRDVHFSYPATETPISTSLDLTLPANKTIAIVGPNGGGKTTLVKLLLGIYAVDRGQIEFDGLPSSAYDRDSLRNGIGVLFQDYVRFELSAYDNIAFGNIEDIGDEGAVSRSAEKVRMSDRLNRLKNGLHTPLGRRFEGAEQLSIGEWQRVAAARALVSEPGIVVLDEPTASMDAESEHALLHALGNGSGRRTTIIVAHSLSAILASDIVLFVGGAGQEIHLGPHAELLDDAHYAEFFERLVMNARGE